MDQRKVPQHILSYRVIRPGHVYKLEYRHVTVLPEIARSLSFKHKYFVLQRQRLYVTRFYQWDGVTMGPNLTSAMRAALVHDVLYQAMGLGLLNRRYRKKADQVFLRLCKEDGVPFLLRHTMYQAIRLLYRPWKLLIGERYEP